jgi:hypothetical protein
MSRRVINSGVGWGARGREIAQKCTLARSKESNEPSSLLIALQTVVIIISQAGKINDPLADQINLFIMSHVCGLRAMVRLKNHDAVVIISCDALVATFHPLKNCLSAFSIGNRVTFGSQLRKISNTISPRGRYVCCKETLMCARSLVCDERVTPSEMSFTQPTKRDVTVHYKLHASQ